jgi:hypothetical protein
MDPYVEKVIPPTQEMARALRPATPECSPKNRGVTVACKIRV